MPSSRASSKRDHRGSSARSDSSAPSGAAEELRREDVWVCAAEALGPRGAWKRDLTDIPRHLMQGLLDASAPEPAFRRKACHCALDHLAGDGCARVRWSGPQAAGLPRLLRWRTRASARDPRRFFAGQPRSSLPPALLAARLPILPRRRFRPVLPLALITSPSLVLPPSRVHPRMIAENPATWRLSGPPLPHPARPTRPPSRGTTVANTRHCRR